MNRGSSGSGHPGGLHVLPLYKHVSAPQLIGTHDSGASWDSAAPVEMVEDPYGFARVLLLPLSAEMQAFAFSASFFSPARVQAACYASSPEVCT